MRRLDVKPELEDEDVLDILEDKFGRIESLMSVVDWSGESLESQGRNIFRCVMFDGDGTKGEGVREKEPQEKVTESLNH